MQHKDRITLWGVTRPAGRFPWKTSLTVLRVEEFAYPSVPRSSPVQGLMPPGGANQDETGPM